MTRIVLKVEEEFSNGPVDCHCLCYQSFMLDPDSLDADKQEEGLGILEGDPERC